MANVDETKTQGKAKGSAKSEALAPPQQGGGRARQAQIQAMTDAGYEAVEKFAKEQGWVTSAPTVIDRDELDNLIGVGLTILEKTVRQGDFGPYLSLVCFLQTDDLVIVNAGGMALEGGGYSGIPGQLEGIDISPDKPHRVPNGLRKSEYVNRHTNTPSVTYYLDYSDEKSALFARLKAKTKKARAGQNGSGPKAA